MTTQIFVPNDTSACSLGADAVAQAIGAAVEKHCSLDVPMHIRNAPTKLMRGLGYGDGYRYDHDEPDAFSGQDYWPEKLGRQSFYEPVDRGFEREVKKRLDWWEKLRRERGE